MISRHAYSDKRTGKVHRHWDISQIRNEADAKKISIGDVIEYKDFRLHVTWINTDGKAPVFIGHMKGDIPEEWGELKKKNLTTIAWGPKGIASSYPTYKENNMIHPVEDDYPDVHYWEGLCW